MMQNKQFNATAKLVCQLCNETGHVVKYCPEYNMQCSRNTNNVGQSTNYGNNERKTNQVTYNRNTHGYGNRNQQTNYRPTNFNHSNNERSNRQVPYCEYCRIKGHSITDCRKIQKLESSITCAYCKSKGHSIENCFKIKELENNRELSITCAYCKTKGHSIENCFKIKEMENNRNKFCSFCRNANHSLEECFKKPKQQQENSGNE